jgi:hypothetical protein
MWLVFQAVKSEKRVVRESVEIPIPGNVPGVAFTPRKDNPSHNSIYQDFLQNLQADGWKLTSNQGSSWWQKQLRRKAQE